MCWTLAIGLVRPTQVIRARTRASVNLPSSVWVRWCCSFSSVASPGKAGLGHLPSRERSQISAPAPPTSRVFKTKLWSVAQPRSQPCTARASKICVSAKGIRTTEKSDAANNLEPSKSLKTSHTSLKALWASDEKAGLTIKHHRDYLNIIWMYLKITLKTLKS